MDTINASEILAQAQAVLTHEGDALKQLSLHLDGKFVESIEAILNCRGRVVISGIGKSAQVARKIVATLNSTGTTSMFLHAADALHGDLGMIGPEDVVIVLSKSGETSELKALMPLLRLKDNLVIAWVSTSTSFLAREADLAIRLPVDQESDPHDLVPTTSSTLQMALGHAMAICLMDARKFTPADFAASHPGGSLGKKLYLRVQSLVRPEQAPRVPADATLLEIIIEISSKRLGATVVIGPGTEVLGIITDGDLRRMLENSADLQGITAADLMSRNPKSISGDAMATEALLRMRANSITQLVVMQDGRYFGLVHLHDLIKEGIV